MRVVVIPEPEMLRNHERARGQARAQQKRPQIVGAVEAARLLDRREFMFRGRPYRVPPLPFRLAAELLDVQACLDVHHPDAPLDETLDLFERAARLSKMACHPAGFVRRLLWSITPNPFRNATPWQVGRNLGFFCLCHILDGELLGMTAQPGTSSPTSQASSGTSRPGRARTATRSRGATS